MATRIIFFSQDGAALYGMDGHHGSAHAARWVDDMLVWLESQGVVDPIVCELTPAEGGEACRRDIIGKLHELRLETRKTPTGQREIIGLNRLAVLPEDPGDPRRMASATPDRIRASIRLVHAPADFAGERQPVRVTRGRLETPPMTAQEARLQRRLQRKKPA